MTLTNSRTLQYIFILGVLALLAGGYWYFRAEGAVRLNTGQGDSLTQSLAAYYKLDENTGTSAADSSGNANTGTLTNGPTWTTGQINFGIDFDGTDDYVTAADADTIDIGDTEDVTLTGWFNRDTFTTDDTIIAKRNGLASGDTGYLLYIDDATDQLIFEVSDGTDEYSLTSTTTFTATGWNHYVVVFDQDSATDSEISINGNANAATKSGTIGNIGSIVNAVALRLGAESDAGNPFDGKLDEARVYRRTLSPDEINRLYRVSSPQDVEPGLVGYWSFNGPDLSGTTAYDRSGKSNTGTLTNGPSVTEGKIGQALTFDGSNDYINVLDSPALDNGLYATYSAWFKLSSMPSSVLEILRKTSGGTEDKQLRVDGSTGKAEFFAFNNPGWFSTPLATKSTVSVGVWYHVVGTYDNGTARIYLNGVLDNTFTASGDIGDGAGDLSIGGDVSTSDYYFPGQIDEVRVYNTALTAEQVKNLYLYGR